MGFTEIDVFLPASRSPMRLSLVVINIKPCEL